MEGISVGVYKGLRRYWRRRGYEKLNGSGRRRRTKHVELGSNRRRRFWRIKIKPKIRLGSPKKFFVWLRDGYMKMMMSLANSRTFTSSGYGFATAGSMYDGINGLTRGPLKEYDDKMIVELYKTMMMAQGALVPRDAANLGSQIVYQRELHS
ncbi:hypothetical protein CMV_006011 [Castanea mollissima]|uniref:Uncharacterized protein n=1 Tax=Castanea mollissima TaxID=60419 RepID=A0A8J4VRM3_9ROSI|nr:hypothetical protein CMV_006011 [Castanea mollissima]